VSNVRMPFGKYRGVRVEDLDAGYCENLLNRWDGRPMAASLRAALEDRVKIKREECAK
jgi:uncharacterized protein (DUF3820 family)